MRELKFCILVVEDDGWIREFVKRILEETGIFDVLAADSGKEAEDITKALAEKKQRIIAGMVIDFVLTDCRGPKVVEMVRKLMGWEVPVLFMTGYDANALTEGGLANGELILDKPFNHHELLRYLKYAFQGVSEAPSNQ